MRRSYFGMLVSGVKTGILVVAVCLQISPFFFFLLVVAHYLGVSSSGLLVTFPVFFFASVFAICWLVSKQTRRLAPWFPSGPPPAPRPAATRPTGRPVKDGAVLIKTRDERYQDLMDILKGDRR